jgi:hypothetical protein
MPDHDPTPQDRHDAQNLPDQQRPIDEYPTLPRTPPLPPQPATVPFTDEPDADEEWAARGPTRGIRLGLPLACLLTVILTAAGFWGGAYLEKTRTTSGTGISALTARIRSARTNTTGTGGRSTPFGSNTSSPGTSGTVSIVDGNMLYILTTTGTLAKVALTPSTTITRNADSKAIDLRPGDTITVQGTTSKNGAVTATSITATAAGVSSNDTGSFSLGTAPGAAGSAPTTTTKS